jgi:hypothetical protein
MHRSTPLNRVDWSPPRQGVLLSSVLESIFGSSHEKRSGRTFSERVGAVAGNGRAGGSDVQAIMESEIIPLRNQLVHGAVAGLEVPESLLGTLVDICRACVTAFLEFLTHHQTDSPSTAEKAFNKRCAAAAAGD